MFRFYAMLLATALFLGPAALVAQDDEGFTWENSSELSLAATGGNSSSRSFAAGVSMTGTGGPNSVKLELSGLRTSSELTSRTATGTTSSFTINETSVSELSAASYSARVRYNRAFTGAFVFAGAGWERNTFSGFEHRYSAVTGFGRTWVEGDTGHFKTDAGLTYTIQKDVEPEPGADDGFIGARVTIDGERTLTETTIFTTKLVADQSIEQGEDFRADWVNSVSFRISDALAFKVSGQFLYDNEPALIRVPLVDGTGTPTGENVRTPGEELDRILTLALVIEF